MQGRHLVVHMDFDTEHHSLPRAMKLKEATVYEMHRVSQPLSSHTYTVIVV